MQIDMAFLNSVAIIRRRIPSLLHPCPLSPILLPRINAHCQSRLSMVSSSHSKEAAPEYQLKREGNEIPKRIDSNAECEEFTISSDEEGERLDKVLAARFERSRSYFHDLLKEGGVEINGSTENVSKKRKVMGGETIRVQLVVPQRELPLEGENIPLTVLYEDEYLAVINKPAGMVVHPAPGNWKGTLAHAIAHRYGIMEDITIIDSQRAGIVHRLDKDTTGVIAIARTREAHDALANLFATRQVHKEYLTVTVGNPAGSGTRGGVIEAPIARDKANRLKMAIVEEEYGGKPAKSTYEVLGRDNRGLLHVVRVCILTGRTHQVRVHMRHLRAPVLGDSLYGALDVNRRFRTAAHRPMLHALTLAFQHPFTDEDISITAPLPHDMRSLIDRSIDPKLTAQHSEWESNFAS